MTKKIMKGEKKLFYCEECLLLYKEKEWVEECEEWCKKNNDCNLEITKHSLKEVYND